MGQKMGQTAVGISKVRRNRKLRLLASAAVIVSSACAYLSYQVIRRTMRAQIEDFAFSEVQKGVDDIERWLSNHQSVIQTIANAPRSQSVEWELVGPYLEREDARLSDFLFLGLSNPQGMRYTTADNRLVDASDRAWFRTAISGAPHINDPFISRATGDSVIAISAPIPNVSQPDSPPIGVIHGGVTTERIETYVNRLQYGEQSYAFLLNSEGRPIIHPNPALMSTIEYQAPSFLTSSDPELAALAGKMVNHEKGISRIKMQGKVRYVAYLPLQSADWSVALVIPRSSIYSQLRMLDLIALVVLALAGLMLVALRQLHKFEQQQLEKSKTTALLDERNRLAREIHDTLAQSFTGISLQLEAARGFFSARLVPSQAAPKAQPHTLPHASSAVEVHILRARDLARKGLSEARRSVQALRSEALEIDTLPTALRKALAQTQRDTALTTRFSLVGDEVALSDDMQLNLLRISQEAVTNTLRHAHATQLTLTLTFSTHSEATNAKAAKSGTNQVQLCIADNGIGFDPSILPKKNGFGLVGIRERVDRFHGTFELSSTPSVGTTIEVVMPLNDRLKS
ncbi:MAG: cache domain-containing protein [Cyanobacteria bacterium J06614_10]